MTNVAVNTYTHSVTYVADNILKSLKDIIRLSGLDPSEFVGDWDTHMRGVQTWLNTGDLETVELEIYDPKTDALIFRWDIDDLLWLVGRGRRVFGPTPSSSDTRSERPVWLQARRATGSFCIRSPDGPMSIGWSKTTGRSTEGMVRQSLGTTIEHSGLGASTSYLRRA